MSVNDVYVLMQFILKKSQKGYVTPSQFNLIINQAQRSYAAFLLGEFQQYQNARPVARIEIGGNLTVRQRLSPIIYNYILSPDLNGYVDYPLDYLQHDAMWSLYGYQRIRMVDQDKLWSYYNSVIDPIATNPICLIEDTGFRFFPTSTPKARLSYVRNPPDITWGYTLDGNGRPVYNAATSAQPVWDDASIYEITARALQMAGVSLQSGIVMKYAEEIKTQGQ